MSGMVYSMDGRKHGDNEQWVATRYWGRVVDRGPMTFDTRAQAEAWAIPPRLRKVTR